MHAAHGAGQAGQRAFSGCHGFKLWQRCGPRGGRHRHLEGEELDQGGAGSGFGIRRPLRFLAHKLDLSEEQIALLARILDELKIERAQAEVDNRRTISAFADAVAGDTFDIAKANEGGNLRVESAQRLRSAVLKALQQIHQLLHPEQRARLAYLIRTGTLLL